MKHKHSIDDITAVYTVEEYNDVNMHGEALASAGHSTKRTFKEWRCDMCGASFKDWRSVLAHLSAIITQK